jgi:hypothetical protein
MITGQSATAASGTYSYPGRETVQGYCISESSLRMSFDLWAKEILTLVASLRLRSTNNLFFTPAVLPIAQSSDIILNEGRFAIMGVAWLGCGYVMGGAFAGN